VGKLGRKVIEIDLSEQKGTKEPFRAGEGGLYLAIRKTVKEVFFRDCMINLPGDRDQKRGFFAGVKGRKAYLGPKFQNPERKERQQGGGGVPANVLRKASKNLFIRLEKSLHDLEEVTG